MAESLRAAILEPYKDDCQLLFKSGTYKITSKVRRSSVEPNELEAGTGMCIEDA